jgi:hypothetical protein
MILDGRCLSCLDGPCDEVHSCMTEACRLDGSKPAENDGKPTAGNVPEWTPECMECFEGPKGTLFPCLYGKGCAD